MLLEDHPAELIRATHQSFSVGNDKDAIARHMRGHRSIDAMRKKDIRVEQEKLQQLSRQLGSLQTQHNLVTQSHNPAEHAAEILRLDTEKFKVAKQVSDLEIEEERLAADLERLTAELEEVDAQGPEGGDAQRADHNLEDAILLKLRVYRMLGIKLDVDPVSGNYKSATILNGLHDSHFLSVNSGFSRKYCADYLWEHI